MVFFCLVAAIVVEIDGTVHDTRKAEDERRESILRQRKLRIVRFSNDEVENDLDNVLEKIHVAVEDHLAVLRNGDS